MRARGVEIAKAILLERLTEVPFAENNSVVEALGLDSGANESSLRVYGDAPSS
jgi:hypothetical protein